MNFDKFKNFKENHKKLFKLIYTFLITIFIVGAITYSLKSFINDKKDIKNPLTNFFNIISKDYDENSLLTQNKINYGDFQNLSLKLNDSKINILNDTSLNQTANDFDWLAKKNLTLFDSEIGYLIKIFIKSESETKNINSFFDIKEINILPTENNSKFQLKSVFSLDIVEFISSLDNSYKKPNNDIKKTTLSTISTIEILNNKLAILNNSTVKINNLNDNENKLITTTINDFFSSNNDSINQISIENMANMIIKDYLNKFIIRTNTICKINDHSISFSLKN